VLNLFWLAETKMKMPAFLQEVKNRGLEDDVECRGFCRVRSSCVFMRQPMLVFQRLDATAEV
jgi:hypothetical protein